MVALLILHGLVGVALLGAITHQSIALFRSGPPPGTTFVDRYTGVSKPTFTIAVAVMYVIGVVLGGFIYPAYRVDVRIPFEEMSLGWAVGLFELKEHFAGIGLGVLPLYVYAWRRENRETQRRDRIAATLLILFVVWWDFLIGHILNNIRGLG